MTTNDKTHVFTVTFTVPDRELQEYGDAWGKKDDQPEWSDNAKAQFASMLQADLYDDCGMAGAFTVIDHEVE